MQFTCESARNVDLLCGEPALFRYLTLLDHGHVGWLRMCVDHAYDIQHDLGSRTSVHTLLRLETLDMTRYHVFCASCFASFMVGVLPDQHSVLINHCPQCGSPVVGRFEPIKDFWQVASEHYGTPETPFPIQLLQMLYTEWPRAEYPRFADYLQAQMESFDNTGEMLEV